MCTSVHLLNRSCYCTGTGSVINALKNRYSDIHSAVMAKPTVTGPCDLSVQDGGVGV